MDYHPTDTRPIGTLVPLCWQKISSNSGQIQGLGQRPPLQRIHGKTRQYKSSFLHCPLQSINHKTGPTVLRCVLHYAGMTNC